LSAEGAYNSPVGRMCCLFPTEPRMALFGRKKRLVDWASCAG
jgi:hypothetical protein